MIPLARHRRFALLALVALILAGCGATGPTSSPPAPSASAISSPDLTPVPGGTTQPSGPVQSAPSTQTDTELGRIWDALPPSFPLPAGVTPTQDREGPVTATFAVGAAPQTVVQELLPLLDAAGFSAASLEGPLEDGSVTMNLVGIENVACVAQVRVTPLSGTTRMVILYGAACPFE